jgi:hypothetical protein
MQLCNCTRLTISKSIHTVSDRYTHILTVSQTVAQPLLSYTISHCITTGFLESTFSYIFGDGDPNADIEQQRLKLLASVIRSAGGAVTAEQLAPYLDPASLPPGYGPNGEINGQFAIASAGLCFALCLRSVSML